VTGQSTIKVIRDGLIWPILGILLSAILVLVCVRFVVVRGNGAVRRKTLVLEMSWKRGDGYYGPNFVHLESPCLANPKDGCSCFQDFKITTSIEFADYIASFGSSNVPVKYDASINRKGQVVGAILQAVGDWPAERFHINERSLGRSFQMLARQQISDKFRIPADCFPTL
jgi:hypothetical protein